MQLQVKSLLSLSDLYQFLVCCASANLLHFLLMTHQKFYLVSISVFHRFCNLTTTCSFRNIFFHLVKQTFKTFTYFCCLHTAVGRFAFYAMIWGFFDLLKWPLKVMLAPWTSSSEQIWIISFKWGTMSFSSSNGCKIVDDQSWSSKKIMSWASKCWEFAALR